MSNIYLVRDDGTLEQMTQSLWESEALLQEFLASNPHLLSTQPHRFVLVGREVGVPDSVAAGDRWSIDHVFLDEEGVLTLVETKRSTDTRLRREVVGQMLDYAANVVANVSAEKVRETFEKGCLARNANPAEVIASLLDQPDTDIAGPVIEKFWEDVRTNVEAERLRLVFVADRIPTELQRIIEFLDSSFREIEVLGLEIQQYVSHEGRRTLVPRAVGQTARSRQRKARVASTAAKWDERSYLEALQRDHGTAIADVGEKILRWCEQQGLFIWWSPSQSGGFVPVLQIGAERHHIFKFAAGGYVTVYFFWMRSQPPFDDPGMRRQLADRLTTITGLELSDPALEGKPKIPMSNIAAPEKLEAFLSVFGWFVETVRNASQKA